MDCEPYRLPGMEFVRRWSLHILPKGFVKTRRFGGYSNRHCERYVAECQTLLRAAGIPPAPIESQTESPDITASSEPDESFAAEPSEPCCPTCGKPMQCLAAQDRTPWLVVMNSPYRPSWYNDG